MNKKVCDDCEGMEEVLKDIKKEREENNDR